MFRFFLQFKWVCFEKTVSIALCHDRALTMAAFICDLEQFVSIFRLIVNVIHFICLVFGIGSLIYIGIEMGGLFEVGFLNNHLSTCGDIFNILRPTLQIAFVFFQMYFIFLNQKVKESER